MSEPDESLVDPRPGVITVWSDIGCPWATLALHTLRATADDLGVTLQLDHRAFPLELYNRRPTPRLILDAEIVAIGAQHPEVGLLLWDADLATYPVSTLPALEAVQVAKDSAVGGLAASDELDARLRRAMYTEHRCISILPEIEAAALDCPLVDVDALMRRLYSGCGRAAVHQQWLASRAETVQGSPQFLTADGIALHNPGVTYSWSASPDQGGLPRLHDHDPGWATTLIRTVDAL